MDIMEAIQWVFVGFVSAYLAGMPFVYLSLIRKEEKSKLARLSYTAMWPVYIIEKIWISEIVRKAERKDNNND